MPGFVFKHSQDHEAHLKLDFYCEAQPYNKQRIHSTYNERYMMYVYVHPSSIYLLTLYPMPS